MSTTLHCPLCGLRFRFSSELDEHAREHRVPPELHLPPHRERRHWGERAPEHEHEQPADAPADQEETSKAIR